MEELNLKICGMFHSSFQVDLQNQVGSGFNHFLVAVNLCLGKALNVLPGVAMQVTGGIVKAQLGVRPFQINLPY